MIVSWMACSSSSRSLWNRVYSALLFTKVSLFGSLFFLASHHSIGLSPFWPLRCCSHCFFCSRGLLFEVEMVS